MGRRRLDEAAVSQIGRRRAESLCHIRRQLRRLRQEVRIGNLQAPGRMDTPRTQQVVGKRQPDIPPLVVGEVEIVGPERILDPFGDPNHGRALDILSDAGMQVGRDDRGVQQAFDAHASAGRGVGGGSGGHLTRQSGLRTERGLSPEPGEPARECEGPTSSHRLRVGHAVSLPCTEDGEAPSGDLAEQSISAETRSRFGTLYQCRCLY